MPKPPAVTVESEYGRELFQELKRARELARQSIKNSQGSQKRQYDKHAKESGIKVGDLVMLKVDPKFNVLSVGHTGFIKSLQHVLVFSQSINQIRRRFLCPYRGCHAVKGEPHLMKYSRDLDMD